jgi:predicted RNA-binding protein YlxR (DUF448 family)
VNKGKTPIRTCFICRVSEEKTKLERMIYRDGKVVIDRNSSGGRGGWFHPTCIESGISKKHFHFAFRLTNEEMRNLDLSSLKNDL